MTATTPANNKQHAPRKQTTATIPTRSRAPKMADTSTQAPPRVRLGLPDHEQTPGNPVLVHPAVASEEAEAIDAEEDRCCYVCG